ncbi:helix-turn-helix domain-containing protein [Novosphingobium sp. 9]|uniref:helix-turn-helix domain-containing protein n=1 Tax=Novosphingobium sp. 9 TaxID=2025349 RepID=UPI0021B6B8BB|nr:helix-turn-helix domain-containing protein [Novosphingobium sp. 9]
MAHEDTLGDNAPTERGNETAGAILSRAREAAGLTRADIAAQTKIAERHLAAIEEDRLGDLAAPTYAVGFARAYARTLKLDEGDIARRVREQLEIAHSRQAPPPPPSFEPGDPARVPSRALAWIGVLAIVVVIGLLLAFWGNFLSPEARLPDLISDQPSAAAPAPRPAQQAAAAPQAAPTGPVVITATQPSVWIKVVDADGKQLIQKVMTTGDSWTVPADARAPVLRVGRADGLKITVGDRTLPPLADQSIVMGNIALDPASLIARADGKPAPAAGTAPAGAASVPATQTGAAPANTSSSASAATPRAAPRPAPRRARSTSHGPVNLLPSGDDTGSAGQPRAVPTISQPVVQPIPASSD